MKGKPLSPENYSAAAIARLLDLQPLDREGGFFRRTLESEVILPGGRRACSAIYLLITPEGFSALHRLAVDEVWCFQAGDALESLRLRPDGSGGWMRLGFDWAAGELLQDLVPAHTWQGTRLAAGGRWALVSCVVAPEFRWEDFELGEADALVTAFPSVADGIRELTRAVPPTGSR